jgi:hypothetical protein
LKWCVAFNAVLTWLRLCAPSIGATTARVTFGIARNAAPVFRPWSLFLTTSTLSRCAAIILGFAQQLRQVGAIRRDPPRPRPLSKTSQGQAFSAINLLWAKSGLMHCSKNLTQ